jgi:hypothetical protein
MHAVAAASGRLALTVLAGLGLGIVVGGVVGRLAMYLLARLNPEATGVVSDDGFVMGQFTLSGTVNLLGAGAFLGVVGGVVYAAARHLTFGPPWWRALSVALGAGLPVGALVVHTDGVDFTLLEPVWLAVALFVLIPALYAVLLMLVVERFSRRPPSWGPLEPLRWVVRGLAAGVVVVAVLDLAGDLAVLT